MGIVPDNELARRYRDALGRSQRAPGRAGRRPYPACLLAGRLLSLTSPDALIAELS